jgi:hypothetical protein
MVRPTFDCVENAQKVVDTLTYIYCAVFHARVAELRLQGFQGGALTECCCEGGFQAMPVNDDAGQVCLYNIEITARAGH